MQVRRDKCIPKRFPSHSSITVFISIVVFHISYSKRIWNDAKIPFLSYAATQTANPEPAAAVLISNPYPKCKLKDVVERQEIK